MKEMKRKNYWDKKNYIKLALKYFLTNCGKQ